MTLYQLRMFVCNMGKVGRVTCGKGDIEHEKIVEFLRWYFNA
jgi:hypothetical protein